MPIYAYRCEACGHELDALQKISDPPLKDCPECGAAALAKQITAAAFRLKGSGWYETDFKKDKQKNLHKDAEPAKDAPGHEGERHSRAHSLIDLLLNDPNLETGYVCSPVACNTRIGTG